MSAEKTGQYKATSRYNMNKKKNIRTCDYILILYKTNSTLSVCNNKATS